MTVNELRVNNWYNSVKFNVPVRCELSDLYELCVRSDGAYNDPPIDEMFEPIPLTEEWLLKAGFEKRLNRDVLAYEKGYLIVEWLFERWTGRHYYDAYTSIQIIQLKYVHQLQNLYFALTGFELTIKL